jgi:RNA polymerase II subunit A C-terminal domain phosphatase SSU72
MGLTVHAVCQSNINRSMAAHALLQQEMPDVTVVSSGVGETVKIPGPTADKPNVYPFGDATFASIEADLRARDSELYQRNGLVSLIARNKAVKARPERFREVWAEVPAQVVFSFEERVYDHVVEWIQLQESHPPALERTHIFNLNVSDTKDEADRGAQLCAQFIKLLLATEGWEDRVPELVTSFTETHGRPMLHCLLVLPDVHWAAT